MQHRLIIAICILISQGGAIAQTCGAGRGDNIFTDGNFGQGNDVILQSDPKIALGYIYTTVMPPNDGFYTITRDMAQWRDIYSAWIRVQDNSPDPRGYMMVINATIQPGLIFEQQVRGLCPDTRYIFSADIINIMSTGTNGQLPNVSFLLNGLEVVRSGPVPDDESWKRFSYEFTTGPAQDSLLLSLISNAPGGEGNDFAIDNISFAPCGPVIEVITVPSQTYCAGEDLIMEVVGDTAGFNYQWQFSQDGGVNWMDVPGARYARYQRPSPAVGNYQYRLIYASDPIRLQSRKCRLTTELVSLAVIETFFMQRDTFCEGGSYVFGNKLLDQSGIYVDTLSRSIGCDSIIMLDLASVVDPKLTADVRVTDPRCAGETSGSIYVTNPQGGSPPYTVTVDGQPGYFDRDNAIGAGMHRVEIRDAYGCLYTVNVVATDPLPFGVGMRSIWEIPLGREVFIQPLGTDSVADIRWIYTESGEPCDFCQGFIWRPLESAALTGIFTSTRGCVDSASLRIDVIARRSIFFPDAFTPNADGLNDRWVVEGDRREIQRIPILEIYNRWGELIFKRENFTPGSYSDGWDGVYKNKAAPPGVYVFRSEVEYIDGQVLPYTGSITLLK